MQWRGRPKINVREAFLHEYKKGALESALETS